MTPKTIKYEIFGNIPVSEIPPIGKWVLTEDYIGADEDRYLFLGDRVKEWNERREISTPDGTVIYVGEYCGTRHVPASLWKFYARRETNFYLHHGVYLLNHCNETPLKLPDGFLQEEDFRKSFMKKPF